MLVNLFWLSSVHAESFKVSSPNGKLMLEVSFDKQLTYSLKVANDKVLENSTASLEINNNNANTPEIGKIINVKRSTINRVLYPHVQQKSKEIIEHYNEIILMFDNALSISFRVFDQGLAYRFSTQLMGDVNVINERAEINFVNDNQVLFPEEKSFISHNERLYLPFKLSQIAPKQFASLPLLINTGHTKMVITETGLRDYPGLWLKGTNNKSLSAIFPHHVLKSEMKKDSDRNERISKRAPYISSHQIDKEMGGRDFPWRIFATSQNDAELLTNQLSYLLADELAIDPTWVKPGQVAWDWWNANNIYGVDFDAGINTQTYKYYIDFAAKYGIEYIVLDEGWHHLDNVLNVVEGINVKEIVAYGKSKNVDVILWVIWKTLDEQLEHALDEFQKWGAAGIKVDFMQRDDQGMVNY